MIVCSCNRISDYQIRQAVAELLEENPNTMLTPGLVYRRLGFRADCGTCLSLAIELIIDEVDHPSKPGCSVIQLFQQRDKLHAKRKNQGTRRKVSSLS